MNTTPAALFGALIGPVQGQPPRGATPAPADDFSQRLAEQREMRAREPERPRERDTAERASRERPRTEPARQAEPSHAARRGERPTAGTNAAAPGRGQPSEAERGQGAADADVDPAAETAAEAARADPPDAAEGPIEAPIDAALQEMLARHAAALPLGAAGATTAGTSADEGPGAEGDAPAGDAAGRAKASGRAGRGLPGGAAATRMAASAGVDDVQAEAKPGKATRAGADDGAAAWQRLSAAALHGAEARALQRAKPGGAEAAGVSATGALGAAAPVSPGHAPRGAEAASVALPTHVHSPDFKAALGMQVSLLARGGVQQAELQLNPAELGPVSVQIVLDGRHAQVNFGADLAQTRQLIESGMPELAAALRDAGFTLTGGGVSQHGRQRADEGTASGAEAATAESSPDAAGGRDDAAAHTLRRTVRIADGRVDLYA